MTCAARSQTISRNCNRSDLKATSRDLYAATPSLAAAGSPLRPLGNSHDGGDGAAARERRSLARVSVELLPAGVVLLVWAWLTGRRCWLDPRDLAWFGLFTLVDACLFQGLLAQGLVGTGAGLGRC